MQAADAQQDWKAPITESTGSPHLHRSSSVTSGRGQPTITIQALAFRAGEHLARFARRGEI